MTSCRSSVEPLACSDIVDERLLGNPAAELGFEEGVQWVHDTFSTEPTIEDYGIRDDYYQYMLRWQQNDLEYTMGYRQDYWDGFAVRWQQHPPTIQDIFRCVGEPAYYEAFYDQFPEALYSTLWLFYPERGLGFYHSGPKRLSRFSETTPMELILYFEPGQLEEVVDRVFIGAESSENSKTSFNPWPGSLEEIVIDESR